MSDEAKVEKKFITIWNKGKRTWPLKGSDGKEVLLGSQESCQVEEVYGLRMVAAYPKDLTTTGVAGPSFEDLKRREQSLRDREANLDAREKALKEKEPVPIAAAIEAIAPFLSDIGTKYLAETDEAWADGVSMMGAPEPCEPAPSDEPATPAPKPRGRPARAQ